MFDIGFKVYGFSFEFMDLKTLSSVDLVCDILKWTIFGDFLGFLGNKLADVFLVQIIEILPLEISY